MINSKVVQWKCLQCWCPCQYWLHRLLLEPWEKQALLGHNSSPLHHRSLNEVDRLLQGLFLPTHCKDSPDNKLRRRSPNIWGQMRCTLPRISRGIATTRLGQAMPLLRHAYHCGQQSSPTACTSLPKAWRISLTAASGAKGGSFLRSKLSHQGLALHYIQALPLAETAQFVSYSLNKKNYHFCKKGVLIIDWQV